MNGVFGPTTRLPGSRVTIQCDAGYVSTVTMVTCDDTLMWSPDPDTIECRSITPTICEFKLLAVYLLCVCMRSEQQGWSDWCVCQFVCVCGHKMSVV